MTRILSYIATQASGRSAFRWSLLALAGTIGGLFLGEMAADPLANRDAAGPNSFSRFSANPGDQVAQNADEAPCINCPDSYGVAARLRMNREQRMSAEFRELGAVDVDVAAPTDADDSYRYGGRFPDPAPHAIAEPSIIAPAADADDDPDDDDAPHGDLPEPPVIP